MGNRSVKLDSPPDTPICKDMSKKYGPECLECVNEWSRECGFPEGGSLSTTQIKKVKECIEKKWDNLIKIKKKVRSDEICKIEKHRKCLLIWEKEAEIRERKACIGNLGGGRDLSGGVAGRTDNASLPEKPEPLLAPPPYNVDVSPPSAYAPAIQALTVTKLHLDLDSSPPLPPPPALPGLAAEGLPDARPANPPSPDESLPADSASGEDASPIQTRAQRQKQATEVHQMPMVEVSGTQGAILVFRAWSPDEVQQHASQLPDPAEDGQKFGQELTSFCKEFRPTGAEIRKLLAKKMKACDLAKIQGSRPDDDLRLKNPDWGHQSNREYTDAVSHLSAACKKAFPRRLDLMALRKLIQGPDELVEDFLHRAEETFSRHSGLDRPADRTGPPGSWEKLLCSTIMDGLKPDVAAQIRQLYVGMRYETRLDELRRHAQHAQDVLSDKKQRSAAKKDSELHKATLTLYSGTIHQRHGVNHDNHRARRRGRRQPRKSDQCHNCGQTGHWKNECPKTSQVFGMRGQAD